MRAHFLRSFLDLVFPPHRDVLSARQITEEDMFAHFAPARRAGSPVYTGLPYREDAVRALIRANKFHADRHAAHLLGAALAELLEMVMEEGALGAGWEQPFLIPVPSSPKRLRERGKNQVRRIIEAMPETARSVYRYAPDVLRREHRESQTTVPKHRRRENIRGAFFTQNGGRQTSAILGAAVILVDDVIESGATMRDAMRALREAGAKEVIGIALAH